MSESKIYLVSDLHLGHANIIKYCNRPFESVEEMNERLIKNWNDTVRGEDRVFFLGDFALGDKEKTIAWGQRLNGRKVMIYGNHDHQKPKVYYEAGFEHVSRWPIIIQNRFLLSHAPFEPQDGKADRGTLINIYGHIHDKTEQGRTVTSCSACVCVERWNYKPVELEVLKKMMKEYDKEGRT